MTKEYSKLFMFLLITIITIIKQSSACGISSPTKADDCKDDTLTQDDKDKDDYIHCCYMKYEKSSNVGSCIPVTSKQYKNFGKALKKMEEYNDYEHKISVDCQSSYLHLFLFALIIQIILL